MQYKEWTTKTKALERGVNLSLMISIEAMRLFVWPLRSTFWNHEHVQRILEPASMNIYVIIFIQTLVSSATHIVAKWVVKDVDTLTLTFVRSLISSTGMLLYVFWRSSGLRVERADYGRILLLAILATVNQLLYLYGMRFTTPANGALLYASTPVWILILSAFLLGERITPKKSAGILLAFLGVAVVILERGVSLSSEYNYGNFVILAAVTCWALFTILGKPMVIKYGATKPTALAMLLGALILFPFSIGPTTQFPFRTLTTLDWAAIFYLGIGTSILGYFLWYYALKRIEAGKLAVFSNGQPIMAAILSMLFLDYAITGNFVVGAAITICGVVLTQMG